MRGVVPATLPWRTGFDAAGVGDEVGEGSREPASATRCSAWPAANRRGANADHAVLARRRGAARPGRRRGPGARGDDRRLRRGGPRRPHVAGAPADETPRPRPPTSWARPATPAARSSSST